MPSASKVAFLGLAVPGIGEDPMSSTLPSTETTPGSHSTTGLSETPATGGPLSAAKLASSLSLAASDSTVGVHKYVRAAS